MTSPSKPTIFQILGYINNGSSYFEDLPDDQLKDLHPYVLTRWLAGSNDPSMVLYVNEVCNGPNNGLSKHKRLLLRLLQTTRGASARPQWIAPPKRGSKGGSLTIQVIQESLGCSKREAALHVEGLSTETIVAEAERLGWQKEEMKKLNLELK